MVQSSKSIGNKAVPQETLQGKYRMIALHKGHGLV